MNHYLKLFIRRLQRDKVFSAINILGLSLGVASSLLIYLYVESELNHDKFHNNAENIYRINQTFIWGDDTKKQFSSTGPGVALAIEAEIPEAELITRVHTPGNFLVTRKNGDKIITFDEDLILAADSAFLQVFTFPLKEGDALTALNKPHSVLITQETAKRYFPDEDPLGKMIQFGRGGEAINYEITGVFAEIPENSYIEFDFLMSMSSFPRVKRQDWTWIWTTFETFVVLNDKADIQQVREKLLTVPQKHAEATLQRIMGISFADYIKDGKEWKLYLQPYTSIHLGSANVLNRLNSTGNKTVVNVLMAAGILILLLSCINYMNLKTAQSAKYAKDTGVRKMMGSSKASIGRQYLVESMLFVGLSIALGLLLSYYALPLFNSISGKGIDPEMMLTPALLLNLLLLLVAMSFISGSYPAIMLSAFKPLDVLRGKISSGKQAKTLRDTLVVLQFTISIGLISSTVIVYQQLEFIFNKEVGFQKENLLAINHVEWLESDEGFTESLKNIPGVISTSLNTSMPPNVFNGDQFLPEDNQNKTVPLNYTRVDEKYIPTLGIELVAGRNFSELAEQEKMNVIINESAVEALGWNTPEDVLQKRIVYPGNPEPFTVIGVARDFNFWSLQSSIEPLAIFHLKNPVLNYNSSRMVAVRVENSGLANIISKIETNWQSQNPGIAFSYSFTDDAFAAGFQSSEQFRKSLTVFALLALFIAGLGLLGMIIYVVEQRKKEIGIRKVLGSNSTQVITLMSKSIIPQVVLALVLSIPITFWVMKQWLIDFQYRLGISPFIFVITGVVVLTFALTIVGLQSYKASQANPVDALKDE